MEQFLIITSSATLIWIASIKNTIVAIMLQRLEILLQPMPKHVEGILSATSVLNKAVHIQVDNIFNAQTLLMVQFKTSSKPVNVTATAQILSLTAVQLLTI